MPHRLCPSTTARAAVVVLVTCLAASILAVVPASAGPPEHSPPVDAAVIDPFRPPLNRFTAGNRGLEYDTSPGTEVHASADGVVTFAGSVAGTRHVTVLHEDGLRTTYSFLDRVDALVGWPVRQGDVVGTTVGHLHFGARLDDSYLDPSTLFGGPTQIRLVPFEVPPGPGPDGERSAISQLFGGIGGLVRRAAGGAADITGAGAHWLLNSGDQLLRTAAHYGIRTVPVIRVIHGSILLVGAVRTAWDASHRPCTRSRTPVAPPPERRVAVLVGGLGSTSESAAIDDVDVGALGYEAGDVLRFSYAGGRTPSSHGGFADIAETTYTKADSQADLRASAERLADLFEQVVAAAAGAPVDVFAHSQGGLVTRLALLELEERHGAPWLEQLGVVATLATPHQGADLATAGHALLDGSPAGVALRGLDRVHELPLDPSAPSAQQLSETSDVIRHLADAGVPEPIELVSIAARTDVVVPVPRTHVPGELQVVVPLVSTTAHDALPGSPGALRELSLALADLPPTCRSFTGALVDQMVGAGISEVEDHVGAVAWAGAGWLGFG